MESEGLLQCSKEPMNPTFSQVNPVHTLTPYSLRYVKYYSLYTEYLVGNLNFLHLAH
jgi:hypothetical protein